MIRNLFVLGLAFALLVPTVHSQDKKKPAPTAAPKR